MHRQVRFIPPKQKDRRCLSFCLAEKERFLRSPMQLHTPLRGFSVAVCSGGLPKQSPGLFDLRPSNLFRIKQKTIRLDGFCFGGEGEIPPQPYATPYATPWLFRCGPLRGATQTVPRTVWLTPFESFLKPNKNTTRLGGISVWRRRRDSNSRTGLTVTRFPIVRARPATRLLQGRYSTHRFSNALGYYITEFRACQQEN